MRSSLETVFSKCQVETFFFKKVVMCCGMPERQNTCWPTLGGVQGDPETTSKRVADLPRTPSHNQHFI